MAKYNENAVREAAYFMWQNAGCPSGNDEYFWTLAIEQLNGKCTSKNCSAAAKKSPAKKAVKKSKASSSLTLKKLMK